MKNLFLLLFFICAASFSHSQEIEKLQKELKTNPRTRLQTAAELRDLFADYSSDSLYSLGNYLLNQGLKDDHQPAMIYGKMILAEYYNTEGKTDFSIKYLNECVNYYQKRKDYENLAHAQNLLGIAYIYSNEYNKAATWLIKSIKTGEKLGPDNESYMGQMNLCEVYIREEKLDLAESEILSFIDKTKKQKLTQGTKKGYDYLAKVYMLKGDMKLSIEYYKKALELALKNKSKTGKANAYNNMAIAHFHMEEIQLSFENFKKALDLRLELGQPLGISESYYNLGDWNYFQGYYDEAIRYYNLSLDVAKQNNLTKETADAYDAIAESLKEKGKFKESLEYKEKYIAQLDIMRKKNVVREIDLQRAAYEVEREEELINHKKREDRIQNRVETEQDRGKIIVIGFSLVVGLLIISYFFLLAKNQKRDEKTTGNETGPSKEEQFRLTESKWNKIEYFIAKEEEKQQQMDQYPVFYENVKCISNFSMLPLTDNRFLFWEASISKLENYILKDYVQKRDLSTITPEAVKAIFESQKLVDHESLTYGIMSFNDNQLSISGKNGLLIQSDEKMSFLTEIETGIRSFTVLISDRLKNELVATAEWDKLMQQMDIIQKMSPKMTIQTMEECWKETLVNGNYGMLLLFPV